jgi:hypothetical protein
MEPFRPAHARISTTTGVDGLLQVVEGDRIEAAAQQRRELEADQDLAGAFPFHDHVEIRLGTDQHGPRLAVDGQDIPDAVVLQVPEDPGQVLV